MIKFTWLRQSVVAVIGFTVLLIGIVMVVLPGPAVLMIPLGLAILATEFVWARRLLAKARATLSRKGGEPKPLPDGFKLNHRSFGSSDR